MTPASSSYGFLQVRFGFAANAGQRALVRLGFSPRGCPYSINDGSVPCRHKRRDPTRTDRRAHSQRGVRDDGILFEPLLCQLERPCLERSLHNRESYITAYLEDDRDPMQFTPDLALPPFAVQMPRPRECDRPWTYGNEGLELETLGVVTVYLVEEGGDEVEAGELVGLEEVLVLVGGELEGDGFGGGPGGGHFERGLRVRLASVGSGTVSRWYI